MSKVGQKSMKKWPFLPLCCHEWQVSGPREVFFNVLLLSAINKESSGSLNLKTMTQNVISRCYRYLYINKSVWREGIGVITARQSYLTFGWGSPILISL